MARSSIQPSALDTSQALARRRFVTLGCHVPASRAGSETAHQTRVQAWWMITALSQTTAGTRMRL